MTPAEKMAAGKTRQPVDPRKPTLACLVRQKRDELGLSLRDVENGTGISNGAISFIERGYGVTLANARKLAAFFGTTVDELWPVEGSV